MQSHARSELRQDIFLASLSAIALAVLLAWIFRPSSNVSAAEAQVNEPALGVIAMQVKDVRRRLNGMLVWTDARQGDTVYDGDGIYVGEGGAAVVKLDAGGHIEIDDKSMVVLHPPRAAHESNMSIDLRWGGASGVATQSPLAIHMQGTDVRLTEGSRASVRLQADNSVAITVPSGSASVQLPQGKPLAVKAMETVDVHAGQAGPVERLPTTLIEPPQAQMQYVHSDTQTIDFAWSPAPSARGYMWQLSADSQFQHVVASQPTRMTKVRYSGLAEGTYYWRVQVAEAHGKRSSEQRTLVVVSDRAPVVLAPLPGDTVDLSRAPELVLSWTTVHGVKHYRVVLEETDTHGVQELSSRYAGLTLSAGQVPEGSYCYRVRADDASRGESPWSRPACFRVVKKPVLRAPKIYKKHPKETGWLWPLVGGVAYAEESPPEATTLRWEAVEGAVAYMLEIATDSAMAHHVERRRVDDAYFRWQPPERRAYFWRVRGIDGDGREGDPSEVQSIDVTAASVPAAAAPEGGPPVATPAEPHHTAAKPHSPKGAPPKTSPNSAAAAPPALAPPAPPAAPRSAPPPMAVATVPSTPSLSRGWVGARIAFFANLGAIATVQPGVEAGVWLPFVTVAPLGARLTIDYYTAQVNGVSADRLITAATRLQRIPITLSAMLLWPMHVVDIVAALGLRTAWTYARTTVTQQPAQTSANVEVGGAASVGVQRRWGPGAIFYELSYALTSARTGTFNDAPSGLAVALGYRLGVF